MVLNPNTSHSHIWESFWLAQLCPLLGHIAEGFSLIHCELLGNSQQFLFKTYCRRIHCELLENSHQFLARPNLADTETSCCKRCWIFSTLLMHQHQKVLNIFSTQNVSSWFCCLQNRHNSKCWESFSVLRFGIMKKIAVGAVPRNFFSGIFVSHGKNHSVNK